MQQIARAGDFSLENQGSNQVEDLTELQISREDELKGTIFDLQVEVDHLKWRTVILEAEKLQKTLDARDSQTTLDRVRTTLGTQEADNTRLQEECKRLQQEQQNYGQELVQKLEREKEQAREMLIRVQNEKERIHAQYQERQNEQENRIKKFESERQRIDLEHARSLRDKESVIDQIRNQNIGLGQALQHSGEEIKNLQHQLRDLQAKVANLNAKRQQESEQVQETFKSQLRQVQDMLMEKKEQWESKQEEMSLELQQMDAMRHKLTQNIIYLQNEIRKRDDLLENSSEFGGDFEMIDGEADDDSSLIEEVSNRGGINDAQSFRGYGAAEDQNAEIGGSSKRQSFQVIKKMNTKTKNLNHALQNQLEDSRSQLKQRIEEKLLTERKLQNFEHTFRKLIEGIIDIRKILDSQHQGLIRFTIEQASSSLVEGEQSSQLLTFEDSLPEDNQPPEVIDSLSQLTSEALQSLPTDETVNQIISKIYDIQRGYESELSDLRHKIKMQQMQIEEGESLKFDIELLQDEKAMLEDDLSQASHTIIELEGRITAAQKMQAEQKLSFDAQVKSVKDTFEGSILKLKQDHEAQMTQRSLDAQKQIEDIHESFRTTVIPALKEKHSIKYQRLQAQLADVTNAMQQTIELERQTNATLQQENRGLIISSANLQEKHNQELDQLRDQINFADIAKQELENQLLSMRNDADSQLQSLQQKLSLAKLEAEDLKAQHHNEIKEMNLNFDQIVQRLKERKEEKDRKLKEVQGTFKELLITFQKEEQEKWNLERDEMNEIIAELRQQLDHERRNADAKGDDTELKALQEQASKIYISLYNKGLIYQREGVNCLS